MLKELTLKNFRKHVNSSFDFENGLSVIRGANEDGKSTMLEGIAYAIFGVKALRSPLAEAVTWGQPENTLRATLKLDVDGTTYTVSRGKSGAEVNYDGGIVTGQTEVTAFLSRLLKVDSGSAPKLMLSSQMDIRGALDAGPKATTELIERLAEFDQIDHLIDLIQSRLTLGSTATAEATLESARQRLDAARAKPEPDFKALERAVVVSQSVVELAMAEVVTCQIAHDAAVVAYNTARVVVADRNRLSSSIETLAKRFDTAAKAKVTLDANPVKAPDNADAEIACIQAKIDGAAALRKASAAHEAVKMLLGYPVGFNHFNGGVQAWQDRWNELQATGSDAKLAIAANKTKLAYLSAEINNNSCTFCGKDFSELPEIQAKNLKANADIAALDLEQARLAGVAERTAESLAALDQIRTGGRPILEASQKYAQWLEVDHSQYPPILTWKGDVPEIEGDQPDYARMITKLREQVIAARAYETNLAVAARELQSTGDALQEAREALQELGDAPNLADLEATMAKARGELGDAQGTRDEARDTLRMRQTALTTATTQWEWATKEIAQCEAAVAEAAAAIKALEFNNALLKRVRTARPIIADRLWNLVLTSVSSYFSEMRGTSSQVTKTSDGFLVDGHPVASLSGSTLDILGLAIRVALVRTFLPAAPFLVLDEPCASMDADRTESLLGFVVAVGFKQVLLVTHENVSESVADHIIMIGE